MKRLLMLEPGQCGSSDTKANKIYEVIEDYIVIYPENKDEDSIRFEATKENLEKYPNAERWVTIHDESSEDSFIVCDEYCVVVENDNKLAHELINRIDSLDIAVVNMAMYFNKDK